MTPGTADATLGTVVLKLPDPFLFVLLTMRSALMALSTLLVADFDSDAPKTAMAETRASPTISAADVCAVRRGLRMEFSRPSRPEVPSRRASGRPMALAMGRATAGASMATPTKISTAPRPTSPMAGTVNPKASPRTPIRVMTPPRTKRRRSGISASVCCSETAATGAMRTARRAGLMAETSVTPDAHDQADDDGAHLEDEWARRQRDAEPAQQLLEPDGRQHAQAEADERRHEPHDHRLAEHGAEHLTSARADDAQQRQLPRALAHRDGEGVQDGEAAHEERDEPEDEQRRVEEAQRLADGARLLVDDGLAGHHLHAVRQRARDGALDGRLVGARRARRR